MKSKEEIMNIAKELLIENPFPYSNYEWDLREDFVELEKENFEYSFQPKKGCPLNSGKCLQEHRAFASINLPVM
jgi:hypothetical protein